MRCNPHCGVIRDELGNLVLAFSHHFDAVDSLVAEARAFLLGLCLCWQFGFFTDLVFEADLMMLVGMLNGSFPVPMGLRPVFREIKRNRPSCVSS
mgnify:FL=1